MDFVSHLMSGVAISISLPDDPDPNMNFIKKLLPIVGSVLPDILPVSFIWAYVAKKAGKSFLDVITFKLTREDYETHAGGATPWIQIYKFFHSVFFLVLVVFVEVIVFGNLFTSWGILAHQLYDLPTHRYKNNEYLNPKPFYPFWGWTFPLGITNGWAWKWYHFVFSWLVHFDIILFILCCRI